MFAKSGLKAASRPFLVYYMIGLLKSFSNNNTVLLWYMLGENNFLLYLK